ncbi:MAG: hypothetical protein ACYDER_09070 [Ktedonobacteraceae bacterium]
MIKRNAESVNTAEELPPSSELEEDVHPSRTLTLPLSILLAGLAFVICTLLMVVPLSRVVGSPIIASLSTSHVLEMWGAWLPTNFQLATDQKNSVLSTNIILFLILTAIAFIIYGFSIWSIRRQPREQNNRQIVSIIGLVTFIAGMIFVLTPAMLSHDIFVYAGYGRLIAAHGANPYFTTLTTFPHDPFILLDDWSWAIAAYGPLWLTICAACAWIFGADPLRYIIMFRLLGLLAHLLNTLLIYKILQKMGRSPRTVVLGTLLYAWNPLALMESSLGGHNDMLMITFILWGILLSVRGEQRGLTRPGSYLPPIIAFTLAALIKYTSGPLIIFFLVILIRKTLTTSEGIVSRESIRSNWHSALLKPMFACIVGGLLALAFYIPYWIGHSIWSIIHSFSAPPSSVDIEYSMLSAINAWITKYGYPTTSWTNTFFKVFSNHSVWNSINAAVITLTILTGIVWLWRKPTMHVFMLATLLTLGSLLIVTPWFFPWYVVWLVALAAIILPYPVDIIGRALTAFALLFSASAYFVYYFAGYQPIGKWMGLDCLATIGPPVLAFICVFLFRKSRRLPAQHARLSVISTKAPSS